jgi:hypothetical protein
MLPVDISPRWGSAPGWLGEMTGENRIFDDELRIAISPA